MYLCFLRTKNWYRKTLRPWQHNKISHSVQQGTLNIVHTLIKWMFWDCKGYNHYTPDIHYCDTWVLWPHICVVKSYIVNHPLPWQHNKISHSIQQGTLNVVHTQAEYCPYAFDFFFFLIVESNWLRHNSTSNILAFSATTTKRTTTVWFP